MPLYLYRCRQGHQAQVIHRMLYSTGQVCGQCGGAMHRVPQAPRVNWNGSRAGQEPAPAIQQHVRDIERKRDEYRAQKEHYEQEKRRIGRD